MKLGEFLKKFSHNNLIRLHYKTKEGNECVADGWNDVSMDWEVNNGEGVFRHYVNNEVLGLVSILSVGKGNHYPEAINIVIEKLDNQPFVEGVWVQTKINSLNK
jgi:hypothetical protein